MPRFEVIPRGAVPVLMTPYTTSDNQVDYNALDAMVEFYIKAGVAGIFTSCLSSEVFELTAEERLRITKRVCDTVNGRVAVVAGGNFGESLEQQARGLAEVYEAGADVAVAIASILPSPEHLGDQLLRLSELAEVPMGVYECPVPEHRLLSAQEVGLLAYSGRFVFMKEASRQVDVCAGKLKAAEGTPLRIFQANLKCTPETVALGAFGHAGVIANICPELCQAYCDGGVTDPSRLDRIYQSMQLIHDVMVANCYPASGKYILNRRGVCMNSYCRIASGLGFDDRHRRTLDAFLEHFDFREPLDDASLAELRAVASDANWKD